jgi:hypothetical protein
MEVEGAEGYQLPVTKAQRAAALEDAMEAG